MAQHKGAPAEHGGAARSSREPVALTEQQWSALAPLVPGADSASRGRLAAPQSVVEGILFAIRNGLGMQSVPPPYPSGSTLYRRFTAWTSGGQWGPIWAAFLDTLSPAERRQWEAAAMRRPGSAADAPAVQTDQLERAGPAVPAGPPGVDGAPPDRAPAERAAPEPDAAKPELLPSNGMARNGYQEHVTQNQLSAGNGAAPASVSNGPVGPVAQAEPSASPKVEATSSLPMRPERPEATPDAAGSQPHITLEAARERVTERLGLSTIQSEIVGRRIDDHGVAAALLALDEVEGRLATGTMRGVGGTPMSAFEIWVCAVGLARRPVERPRAPRPERSERYDNDRNDRDRRKRQWRKAP